MVRLGRIIYEVLSAIPYPSSFFFYNIQNLYNLNKGPTNFTLATAYVYLGLPEDLKTLRLPA